MKTNQLTLLMAFVAMQATVSAKEVEIPLKDCPAAVQATFTKQAGKGTVTGTESITDEKGIVIYEAAVKSPDGKEYEVVVAADGTLIQTERNGKSSDCPAVIQKALADAVPGGKIGTVEIITKADGTMEYEAEIKDKDGETQEALVSQDGKLLKVEEIEEDDEKDEKAEKKKEEK